MEIVTLKALRKKQFIALNCGCIIGLALFFLLLYVGIPLNKIMLFLGIILLLTVIFKNQYIKYIFKVFPYKEKLFLYEKNKLGREWYRLNKMNNIATVVLGIVTLLQGIISDTVISLDILIITIILSPLFLILLNGSFYFHIKKIDNDGNSSFNGYTKKRLILSILAAIAYIVIINSVIILLIKSNFI